MKIKVIKPSFFRDKRGDYWTTWRRNYFNKLNFNHDKFSISKKCFKRLSHRFQILEDGYMHFWGGYLICC